MRQGQGFVVHDGLRTGAVAGQAPALPVRVEGRVDGIRITAGTDSFDSLPVSVPYPVGQLGSTVS